MNTAAADHPERNDQPETASGGRSAPSRPRWWLVAAVALGAVAGSGWWLVATQPGTTRNRNPPHTSGTSSPRAPSKAEAAIRREVEGPQKPQVVPAPQEIPNVAGDDDSRAASDPEPVVPKDAAKAIAEALRIARQLVADFPQNPDALEAAARAQWVLGSTAEAEEGWQKCLEVNPQYAYAYAGLGVAAARRGELRQAVVQFRRALEIDPGAVQTRLDLAQALFDLGEMEDAARLLEEHLRHRPASAEARVLLGMIRLQQGDTAQAREHYEAAVRSQPQDARARLGLANAYTRLGQTELAREAMAEFQKLRAQERQTRQSDLRGYDDVAALGEELANVCMNASRIYHARGRSAEAERLWRYAAAVDAANVDSRQALAWMHRQRGQRPQAIQFLQELAAIEPANPSYPLEVGRVYAELGQRPAAEAAFREACRRDPRLSAGHASLASLYLKDPGQAAAALTHARAAVDLQPTAAHYGLLGAACQLNGDRNAARTAWSRAAELDPQNVQYRRLVETLSQEK